MKHIKLHLRFLLLLARLFGIIHIVFICCTQTGVIIYMNLDISKIKSNLARLTAVADHTGEFDEKDIKQGRLMAMTAALPVLFWLPLVRRSRSRFVRFHANNGLVLLIACAAASVLTLLLRLVPAGWLIIFPMWGFLAVESVFSSIDALCGNARELHLLGRLKLKLIK